MVQLSPVQEDSSMHATLLSIKRTFLWLFRLIVAVMLLVFVIVLFQQVINYLTYDLDGPSTPVIALLARLGFEESLGRAVYWYVLQIVFSLLLIKLVIRKKFTDVGFNLHNGRLSRRLLLWFFPGFLLAAAMSWYGLYALLGIEAITGGVEARTVSYMVKDIAIFGLLPGPGEEPLFRVFVIQFLIMVVFKGKEVLLRWEKAVLIVVSSILFMAGHVFVLSFAPLQLKYDVLQLVISFSLGVFYAFSYLYTKSLVVPIVCHNYTDLVVRAGSYLLLGLA